MRRRSLVLGALVAVGALSISVSALQQPAGQAAPRVVEVEKLRDNLYVMRGGGGNSAVFVTANGVVVVDTKNPGWGAPLLEKIRSVTDRPVTTIVNTHTHGDHVSGNVEFPATVEVVTHANTKANMEAMRPAAGGNAPPGQTPPPNIFQANGGRGLPRRTFTDTLTLGSGNDRIDLYYFGRGHTNGDTFVVFPALRVMHAGDIFSGKNLPLLDTNNGGSGLDIGGTLAKASGIPGVDAIITGHSAVMAPADLREYAEFNRDFADAMRAAKTAGRSVDDVAGTWTIPAKYAGYAAPAANRLRANVQVLYDEIR